MILGAGLLAKYAAPICWFSRFGQRDMPSKKSHLSSLPLQVVLYFSGWYLLLLYVAELALVIYKGEARTYHCLPTRGCYSNCLHGPCLSHHTGLVLPYPARNLAAEIILILFLAVLDVIRIFLGWKSSIGVGFIKSAPLIWLPFNRIQGKSHGKKTAAAVIDYLCPPSLLWLSVSYHLADLCVSLF